MTEQECIEWMDYLGNMKLAYDRSPNKRKTACDIAIQALEEIQQYRALGTVEELRVARDKQVAKKVIPRHIKKYDGFDDGECPTCGHSVLRDGFSNDVYCDECGQKLDWSDEDDNH